MASKRFFLYEPIYIKALFITMNNEFSRWHKLAGLLTESQNWQSYISEGDTDYDRAKDSKGLGKSGEEHIYGAGVEAGEKIEKKKMTKSEARQAIKDAILAEMGSADPDEMESSAWDHAMREEDALEEASPSAMDRMSGLVSISTVGSLIDAAGRIISDLKEEGFDEEDIYDFIVDKVRTLSLDETLAEAKKEEEADVDVTVDAAEETPEGDVEMDMTADSTVDADMAGGEDLDAGSSEAKKAFNELTDAYRAAKELGDEKLVRQLANTITYFNKNIILQND